MSFRNSSRNELSYSELYRKHVDLAVEAEEMGYDTIWLTEHHFVEDGYSPSIGAAGGGDRVAHQEDQDRDVRTADAAVSSAARRGGRGDARRFVQRALRSGTRAGLTCRASLPVSNIVREERSRRLREGVEIVRRLFTEKKVTFRRQALYGARRDALSAASAETASADLDWCAIAFGD